MIPRLIDPSDGEVLIGGKNIKNFQIKDLRNLISMVSQESGLFDETIRANITLGRKIVSDSDLKQVIKDSFLEEVIE